MHSAHFRAWLLTSLLLPFSLFAGLEELTIMVSPDGKQYVILGGDNHDREPGTQTQRLAAAIAECQKQDPSTFEVYVEKPAGVFSLFDQKPNILRDIIPVLNERAVPGVKVEDCEVRNVAVLAFWLFGMEYPHGVMPKIVINTRAKKCKVGEATMQDLDIEFEEMFASSQQFSELLPNPLKEKITSYLEKARNQMNGFKKLVAPYIHESDTVLQTAIKLADYDLDNPGTYERERIQYAVCYPFSALFELNLIQKLLDASINKRLILCGLLHSQAIRDFLAETGWNLIDNPLTYQRSQDPEQISLQIISRLNNIFEE